MVKELLYREVLQLKCTHPLKYTADLYTVNASSRNGTLGTS